MNPIIAWSMLTKIWGHPDLLQNYLRHLKKVPEPLARRTTDDASDNSSDTLSTVELPISGGWTDSIGEDYRAGELEQSGKMRMLVEMLVHTLKVKEKMLVFSQSVRTLDLMEAMLPAVLKQRCNLSSFRPNKDYFRLDGTTKSQARHTMCSEFNRKHGRVKIFFISTKAGGLGINLTGANRVVLFDTSWNPAADAQAVCRVYRYGQLKPVFIYRLVAAGSLERSIYDRSVHKATLANRVVDQLQQYRLLTQAQTNDWQAITACVEVDLSGLAQSEVLQKDAILRVILLEHPQWLGELPLNHDCFLEENVEERMTPDDLVEAERLENEEQEKKKMATLQAARQRALNALSEKQMFAWKQISDNQLKEREVMSVAISRLKLLSDYFVPNSEFPHSIENIHTLLITQLSQKHALNKQIFEGQLLLKQLDINQPVQTVTPLTNQVTAVEARTIVLAKLQQLETELQALVALLTQGLLTSNNLYNHLQLQKQKATFGSLPPLVSSATVGGKPVAPPTGGTGSDEASGSGADRIAGFALGDYVLFQVKGRAVFLAASPFLLRGEGC